MSPLLYDPRVAVVQNPAATVYPDFPYTATAPYSELQAAETSQNAGFVSQLVRQTLVDLQLDQKHIGSAEWNPFGEFISPGQTILLKPNWVRDYNPIDSRIDSLITHTAVIRAVIEYVIIALDGRGTIILADAPLQSCNFERLVTINRIRDLMELLAQKHRGITFRLIDLRKTVLKERTLKQTLRGEEFQTTGDGADDGYTLVKLDHQSLLTDLDDRCDRFRVTHYDHTLMQQHHNRQKNEYLVGNPVLESDVIVNLPKMKTHIKAGLTGALKNLIGINGHKEFLPHHMDSSFLEGGDQYVFPSRFKQSYNRLYDRYWSRHRHQNRWTNAWQTLRLRAYARLSRLFDRDDLFDGGWFGNETIPRTTIDLNHILYFYDLKTGALADRPIRTVFHLVDGIIAGQKDGPLQPTEKAAGTIIAGFNPLLVDLAMAQLIGYRPAAIKTLFYGFYHKKSRLWNEVPDRLEALPVSYNGQTTTIEALPNLGFELPEYWRAVARTGNGKGASRLC